MLDAADRPATLRSAPQEAIAAATLTGPACAAGEAEDVAPEAPRVQAATESLWTHLGHELRTPLHAIMGNVELLVDGSAGPLSADARACLGDVQNAGRQLLRQVDRVLLLLQAAATPAPVAEAEVDLLARLRAALHGQVAGPALEPQDARLVLRGDPFWLETWVSALVEGLLAGAGGSAARRISIERLADPAPHEVGLRIAGWDNETRPWSPVTAMLIDAIVRLHGGRMLPQAGPGVCIAWPAARLVTWHSG